MFIIGSRSSEDIYNYTFEANAGAPDTMRQIFLSLLSWNIGTSKKKI